MLGGADVVDGTPILDIKPYLKHDIHHDAHVPEWCERPSDASNIVDVRFSDEVAAFIEQLGPKQLRFFADPQGVRDTIEQMLMLDIRSVVRSICGLCKAVPHTHRCRNIESFRAQYQGRGQVVDNEHGQAYTCRVDNLELTFTTFHSHVEVSNCALIRSTNHPAL